MLVLLQKLVGPPVPVALSAVLADGGLGSYPPLTLWFGYPILSITFRWRGDRHGRRDDGNFLLKTCFTYRDRRLRGRA